MDYNWNKNSTEVISDTPVGLINIFKERYDKNHDTSIINPYALSGNDKEITESANYERYPYRYFPLPTLENIKGSKDPVYYDLDFIALKNPKYAGQIEITYKNIYGTNNKITIYLEHRVSPAYTNNLSILKGNGIPPRIAMNWDETEEKTFDEIFPDNSDIISERNSFPAFFGKHRIPKNY